MWPRPGFHTLKRKLCRASGTHIKEGKGIPYFPRLLRAFDSLSLLRLANGPREMGKMALSVGLGLCPTNAHIPHFFFLS